MGNFVNPGNDAFQATLNAKIYVDKSGLLNYTNSVLASTDAYICNSRPRRFGKSITANMLTAYYSRGCDSEEMFSQLEISQSPDFKKHLNKYDVIHLDVQWCMAGRWPGTYCIIHFRADDHGINDVLSGCGDKKYAVFAGSFSAY